MLFVLITAIMTVTATRWSAPAAALAEEDPRVLVIDAGHGGLDGGAVSADGRKESELNLEIAGKLYDLCRLLGIRSQMTRHSETLPYPPEAASIREKKTWDQQRRAAMINATDGAVLLSIHLNHYPDERPSGTQVLYGKADGSEAFAGIAQELMRQNLCPENRRLAVPASDAIYLMRSVSCPAILVECGFLSNPEEAQKLASSGYQTKIAMMLCTAYISFTGTA